MGDKVKGSTLPKIASIFTAELQAINLAIGIAEETPFTQYAVFSDSLSALTQLGTGNTDNHLVQKLLVRLCNLKQKGKEIVFSWIPSYVGIEGNERVDAAAKQATSRSVQFVLVPYQDWYGEIKKKTWDIWESRWRREEKSMAAIKEKPGKWKRPASKLNRREETILSRLRMGHTNLTHSYRFNAHNAGQAQICSWCGNAVFGVKHILLTCPRSEGHRRIFFGNGRGVANMTLQTVLGENCNAANLMRYLKTLGIYDKV